MTVPRVLRRIPRPLALCAAFFCLASPLAAEPLSGQLRLVEDGKARTEYEGVVIYFTPESPMPVEPLEEPAEITTVRKQFLPRVVAVTPGSKVRFPNQDPILHNVFSVSGRNRFDLGFYKSDDEGKDAVFNYPGVVRVFCNVHHEMVAYVVVVETPFITSPEADGRFELTDLPAGPGTLTIWHERAEPMDVPVTLPLARPLELDVELTRPRVPKHTNKFGKPYSRRKRGKAYN